MAEGNSLAVLAPRTEAGGRPWSDHWYHYVNDPTFGMVKVAFLWSLTDGDDAGPRAYVHVALDPVSGPSRQYDHHTDDFVAQPVDDGADGHFLFEVPGVARFERDRLRVTLPEVDVDIDLTGPFVPYFPDAPGASPFLGDLLDAPMPTGHWMITTLGSPVAFRVRDAISTHDGTGLMYAERGWGTAQAHGFTYMVGVADDLQLMFAGGVAETGEEIWGGRIRIGDHDLTFLPFREGHAATSHVDGARARAHLDITDGRHRAIVEASAPRDAFYDHTTPSLTVFGSDNPVMKTMDAHLEVVVLDGGVEVARAAVPQAILEFGGVRYAPTPAAIT